MHVGLDACYAAGPRVCARLATIPHPYRALYRARSGPDDGVGQQKPLGRGRVWRWPERRDDGGQGLGCRT